MNSQKTLRRTQSSPSLLDTKEPISLASRAEDIIMQPIDVPCCINISRMIRHIIYIGMDSQHTEDAIYAFMTLNNKQMHKSLRRANVTIEQFDSIARASLEEEKVSIPFKLTQITLEKLDATTEEFLRKNVFTSCVIL